MPLHWLLLSLSRAQDHVHPMVADHQQRVAYIALATARAMNYSEPQALQVMQAALLHDIGLVRAEHRVAVLHSLENLLWHCRAGYELLHANPAFSDLAPIVLYHHLGWADRGGLDVPPASFIISLADSVERAIDRREHVLDQQQRICTWVRELAGKRFNPDCVEGFLQAARAPAFWLDCACNRTYSILLEHAPREEEPMTIESLQPVAELFSHVVDAASRWTATHSAGVAAAAEAMAGLLDFTPQELAMIRVAGQLHDIGKISLPSGMLEKSGRLTEQEWRLMRGHTYHSFQLLKSIDGMPQIGTWGAYHHERLDGDGYPFRLAAKDLPLGSRIVAVADTFSALTEDRPYRRKMNRFEATKVLERLAVTGGIDGDVVHVVRMEFESINALRLQRQQAQLARHRQLIGSMDMARAA